MSRRGDSPRPGPLTPWQYVQNGLFYLHVALATLIMGLVGIPLVMSGGRAGANRVATRWIGYVLWAARLHMRVSCEVRGVLPAGDCIVAAKHQCFLDILTLAYALPRRNFIMKREVMRVPVMGWYAWKVGCIPIDRSRGRDAMRAINGQIRERMAGDGLGQLIIYPEGTRTRPGTARLQARGRLHPRGDRPAGGAGGGQYRPVLAAQWLGHPARSRRDRVPAGHCRRKHRGIHVPAGRTGRNPVRSVDGRGGVSSCAG